MNNIFSKIGIFLLLFMVVGCSSLQKINTSKSPYNAKLCIQENLENNVPILEILTFQKVDSLYGKMYEGGLIFYIDEISGSGLVAATIDQSSAAKWGCIGKDLPGAQKFVIGSGNENTQYILAGCLEENIAAKICADLSLNGKKDWFLPSSAELFSMKKNLYERGLGNFIANTTYWSSMECKEEEAYTICFNDINIANPCNKTFTNSVRAIRAF